MPEDHEIKREIFDSLQEDRSRTWTGSDRLTRWVVIAGLIGVMLSVVYIDLAHPPRDLLDRIERLESHITVDERLDAIERKLGMHDE